MIKVLKQGKKRIVCPHCESVLLYEDEDIKSYSTPSVDMGCMVRIRKITCPVCDEEVEVKK